MERIPDDLLSFILCENEHAASCSRRFYRLILRDSYLCRSFQIILYGCADEIRSLSYADLYRRVFTICIRRQRHKVHVAFNGAMRGFEADRVNTSGPDARKRARMLEDVLLYFDKTRIAGAQSVASAIQSKTQHSRSFCTKALSLECTLVR